MQTDDKKTDTTIRSVSHDNLTPRRKTLLWLPLFLLAACSGIGPDYEAPIISLSEMSTPDQNCTSRRSNTAPLCWTGRSKTAPLYLI